MAASPLQRRGMKRTVATTANCEDDGTKRNTKQKPTVVGGGSNNGGISGITEDILRLILYRVPADTVHCSCRLVSKLWRSIVEEPDFQSAHFLAQEQQPREHRTGIVSEEYNWKTTSHVRCSRREASCISLYAMTPPVLPSRSPFLPSEIAATADGLQHHHEFCRKECDFLVGSEESILMSAPCNGLVCLTRLESDSLIVVNLSTRQSISYPNPRLLRLPDNKSSHHEIIGIVCDKTEKLYKIVYMGRRRRRYPWQEPEGYSVKVLTLGLDTTWRCLKVCPKFYIRSFTSSAGGAMFIHATWFSVPGNTLDHVVAFDIETEKFQLIQLPNPCEDPEARNDVMNITVTGGRLYLTHVPWRHREQGDMNIWVRKTEGAADACWEQAYTIRSHHLCRGLRFFFNFYWDEERIFLGDINHALYCYNVRSDTLDKIHCFPTPGFRTDYQKTLLCPWIRREGTTPTQID